MRREPFNIIKSVVDEIVEPSKELRQIEKVIYEVPVNMLITRNNQEREIQATDFDFDEFEQYPSYPFNNVKSSSYLSYSNFGIPIYSTKSIMSERHNFQGSFKQSQVVEMNHENINRLHTMKSRGDYHQIYEVPVVINL